MDYSTSLVQSGQIRLITILPPERGQDPWTSQIKCLIEAVDLRPTPAKAGKGGLPENYIHFDEWVTSKPEEAYGAAFFRDIREVEEKLKEKEKEGKRSKAKRVFASLVGGSKADNKSPEQAVMEVDVNTFGQLVTRDDIITNLEHQELLDSFKLTTITGGPSYIARFSLKDLPPFYSTYGQNAENPTVIDGFTNFVAMSYAWGDPNGPKTTVLINGYSHQVGESLYTGLRRFRTMEFFQRGGKIWIDALCINQNDNDEKQEQLKLMGNVYQFAGNIVVWLGEEADESDQAIHTLQSTSTMYRTEYIEVFDHCGDPILAAVNREQAHFRLTAMLRRYHKMMRENSHLINNDSEDRAIYHFFNRSYWRRLWIIQELSNGRAGMPVVCGNTVTQWRYIRDAALVYAALFDLVQGQLRKALQTTETIEHSVYHVAGIAQLEIHGHRKVLPHVPDEFLPIRSSPGLKHGPMKGSALKQALVLASQSNAFMAKDRVFGMLQIPGLPDLKIDVDYQKSIGTIYKEFATACIEASDNLEILFLIDGTGLSLRDANDNEQALEYLPSWVPDFGAKRSRRSGPIEGTWYAGAPAEAIEKLPKGVTKKTDKAISGDLLSCWGFFADVITGLGAISPLDQAHSNLGDKFEAGVFQPTNFEDIITGYGPEYAASDEVVSHIRYSLLNLQDNPLYEGLDNDEIWRVLTAGTLMGGAKAPLAFRSLLRLGEFTPSPNQEEYRNWNFINASSTLLLPDQKSFKSRFYTSNIIDITAPMTTSARQAMEYRTRNRRLIVSSRGHLGLAPMAVQPGDCILIIVGHDTPIIARPAGMATDGETGELVMTWTMIGESWVSGMMDGQMFQLEYSVPSETEMICFV